MLAPPTDDPLSAMTKQTLFVERRSTHVVTLFVSVATTSARKRRGPCSLTSDDPLPKYSFMHGGLVLGYERLGTMASVMDITFYKHRLCDSVPDLHSLQVGISRSYVHPLTTPYHTTTQLKLESLYCDFSYLIGE